MAASGNMKQFEKLYNADNSRVTLKDVKGQTVLHHAASKSRIAIMEYIMNHGGGRFTISYVVIYITKFV